MNDEINNTEQQTNNELLNTINKDEFELRERRLNLVYKILYIFAISLGVTSLIAVKYIDKNPVEVKSAIPLFCFLLSFLIVSLIYIIYYIFSELKCMKINESIKPEDKQQADKDFENIGIVLSISLLFSAILFFLNIPISNFILFIIVGIFTALVISITLYIIYKKKNKNIKLLFFIFINMLTLSAYLIFMLAFTATLTV